MTLKRSPNILQQNIKNIFFVFFFMIFIFFFDLRSRFSSLSPSYLFFDSRSKNWPQGENPHIHPFLELRFGSNFQDLFIPWVLQVGKVSRPKINFEPLFGGYFDQKSCVAGKIWIASRRFAVNFPEIDPVFTFPGALRCCISGLRWTYATNFGANHIRIL